MGVTPEIATADFQDWVALHELLTTSYAYMDGLIDPPSSLRLFTPEKLAEKAGAETLIIVRDGLSLAGCAFCAHRSDALYLGKIAVSDRYRRRGLLRKMMETAKDLARMAGCSALELECRVEITENHETYQALGFREVARNAHPGFTRPTSITFRLPLD